MTTKHALLIVDDEQAQRESLAGFLVKKGYTVHQAATGEEALRVVQRTAVDLALTDLRMPTMDGHQLLREIHNLNPEVDVIVMTAFGSLESAVSAMKDGALDFITKPIDLLQLEMTIVKALERKQLLSENRRLRDLVQQHRHFQSIITSSPNLQEQLSIASRAADSNATVLILGESGVGKELVAKAVHLASPRAEKPFVAVNMAALPEHLLESEMFGHEKGAFTGADKFRKGRFETADGGTLFIDEVGDIPAGLQVKLLRVLQTRSFERLGSSQPLQVDIRLIAATHRNLETMVKENLFRQDLYYRLNVVQIRLPALRERRADIPALADHFLQRFATMNGKSIQGFFARSSGSVAEISLSGQCTGIGKHRGTSGGVGSRRTDRHTGFARSSANLPCPGTGSRGLFQGSGGMVRTKAHCCGPARSRRQSEQSSRSPGYERTAFALQTDQI